MDIGVPLIDEQDEKIKLALLAYTGSDSVFSRREGPSNAEKLDFIRAEFSCPDCNIFADFPYQELYNSGGIEAMQAGYYLTDLRIQAIDRLIEECYPNLVAHYKRRLVNLSWKTKYRERVNLYNMGIMANEHRSSIN